MNPSMTENKKKMATSKTQIVTATYTGESRFKIPDGIDLDDIWQNDKYFFKWNVLHLCVGDKDNENDWIEIEAHVSAEDGIDWKDGAEFGVEEYDKFIDGADEEEEEQEEEEECR